MNPIFYKSIDSGAPALSGQAGTLTALLDACLVNGYGSKAAAGWTIPFTASNKRVYRAPAGVRHYCYVDDSGVAAPLLAPMVGYRTMTAVGVGSGIFPPSLIPNVSKSSGANSTTLPWLLVADDRSFIFLPGWTSTVGVFLGVLHVFGEFYSLKAGDAYRSLCAGTNPSSNNWLAEIGGGLTGVARHSTQVGQGITMSIGGHRSMSGMITSNNFGSWMSANFPFPNPGDNGIHVTRMTVESPTHGLRGYIRGLWGVDHDGFSTDLSDLTDVDGDSSGPYIGRNFVMVKVRSGSGNNAWLGIETTPWDVNS